MKIWCPVNITVPIRRVLSRWRKKTRSSVLFWSVVWLPSSSRLKTHPRCCTVCTPAKVRKWQLLRRLKFPGISSALRLFTQTLLSPVTELTALTWWCITTPTNSSLTLTATNLCHLPARRLTSNITKITVATDVHATNSAPPKNARRTWLRYNRSNEHPSIAAPRTTNSRASSMTNLRYDRQLHGRNNRMLSHHECYHTQGSPNT